MMLGSRISRVLVAVAPLLALAACGDDTNPGSGGAGGAGTTSTSSTGTPTTTSTGSPTSTSVASSSASSSSSDGGGGNDTTSNGGGGNVSDGGGGNVSDGGGGASEGGGGANQGGGGEAPGLPIDGEDCDTPSEYDLTRGTVTTFEGDTTGAVDDYDTCDEPSADYDGGDLVLTFTLPLAGSVRIQLRDGVELDGNLVFRGATCDSDASEVCLAQPLFGTRKVYSRHLEPGTYSVIVDSLGDAEGAFDLDISYQQPVCGDSILNPGEECDVGAGFDNDQCGNPGAGDACQLQDPPVEPEQCPGEALALDEGENAFLASQSYSTLGFVDHSIGSCFEATGGADRVFAFTPTVTGTAVATVGFDENNEEPICAEDLFSPNCWDQFIYVRTDCLDTESEVACADETQSDGETVTFDVIEGETIFLFVDGYDEFFYSQGPFNLFVTVTP